MRKQRMRSVGCCWKALLSVCALLSLNAAAQNIQDISQESHYHLLLENEKVRIFSLDVGPHSETSLVRHPNNYLVIHLQESEIAAWNEGESDVITHRFAQDEIHFYFGGKARAIRNDTATGYHCLMIEFLNPKVTTYGYQAGSGRWTYGSDMIPTPVDPRVKFATVMPLGEATVKDIQLLPDDAYPAPEKDADELIVALTDVDFRIGEKRIRKSKEDLIWIPAGRQSQLINNGADPSRFVLIELR
ncbi:MAG TPA: hypothetical protein VFA68_17540 [Terriglobales bacterium]|nr:hypothetical protein [Terriglobales bacterium]